MRRGVLVALDSVGIDPEGHDRPGSVYAGSAFLFPAGRRGPLLALDASPVEGALVETDVTGGRAEGAIECAITYASIFGGREALEVHGLMQGLGLRDRLLEQLVVEGNLFRRFERPCLANALFPFALPFLRGSYVDDLLPALERAAVERAVTWEGAPLVLKGPDKRGFAELFTLAELNQNVFVHAARQAGLALRTWEDVRRGQALTSTLTHALERSFDWSGLAALAPAPLPARTPEQAAEVLADLAAGHDFVFYKYQLADLVSHTGRVDLARAVFAEIEAFLGALCRRLEGLGQRDGPLLVVTSDHGHLEQVAYHQGHPKSRVPTWVFGHDALRHAAGLTRPSAIHALFTTSRSRRSAGPTSA